jgi:hypothetical protein
MYQFAPFMHQILNKFGFVIKEFNCFVHAMASKV